MALGNGSKRYIVTKRWGVIELTYSSADRLFRDSTGIIFALRSDGSLKDLDPRCGVSPFVLPMGTAMDDPCRVHDYMYESPAYQLFYTRKAADREFLRLEKLVTSGSVWRTLAKPFYFLTRLFGKSKWENKDTNN